MQLPGASRICFCGVAVADVNALKTQIRKVSAMSGKGSLSAKGSSIVLTSYTAEDGGRDLSIEPFFGVTSFRLKP